MTKSGIFWNFILCNRPDNGCIPYNTYYASVHRKQYMQSLKYLTITAIYVALVRLTVADKILYNLSCDQNFYSGYILLDHSQCDNKFDSTKGKIIFYFLRPATFFLTGRNIKIKISIFVRVYKINNLIYYNFFYFQQE